MILQSIKKELILVLSDLHSLAVLFLLPVIFMLIMTFAMSGRQADVLESISLYVDNQTMTDKQSLYVQYLTKIGYTFSQSDRQVAAVIHFEQKFDQSIFSNDAQGLLTVDYHNQTSPPIQAIVGQHLQLAFARLKLHLYMLDSGELDDSEPLEEQMAVIVKQTDTSNLIQSSSAHSALPVTAYSVPSWLIFGVYFIVLPISITLLNEKQSGTLIRLRTFPINLHGYFLIKLLAFYFISVVQFVILSLIGLRIIPEVADLPLLPFSRMADLLPVGLLVCLGAVCFASIIAAIVKSYEQAIVIGGGINIILAALSGFMVPLDILPPSLQYVAQFSPMFWSSALVKESMFAVSTGSGITYITYLSVFSVVALGISSLLFTRKIRNLLWN